MAYKLSAAGMELRTPTHGAMKNKEDTTMKKFITDIKTLAALLMAGAAFTACSSDDNIIEQPQNPTEPKVYTLVIKASKGTDTTTRALKDVSGEIKAFWSGTETIEVGQYNYTTEKYDIIGEANAAPSADGNTTITAELTSAPDPDKDLNFFLGGSTLNFTGQVGLLTGTNSISEKYDYASDCLTSGSFTVDEINNKVIPNKNNSRTLEFRAAEQAIIKFTLKDKANNEAISPTAFTVSDGTNTVELTSIPTTTYDTNGDGVLYVAFPPGAENTTITLTATVGDDTYTYTTPSTKTFWRGQYYEITVKMTKQEVHIVNSTTGAAVEKVNGTYSLIDGESYTMSGIGSGDIYGKGFTLTIEDGTILTGCIYYYNVATNIILNGNATVTKLDSPSSTTGYFVFSGSGTLTVTGKLTCTVIWLADGVTIKCPENAVIYAAVKNADGSADITPTTEGGYKVYVGSGTVSSPKVTVWFVSNLTEYPGTVYYVVYNNDETQYPLTATGDSHGDYNCYTATLPNNATTYNVVNPWGGTVVTGVSVAEGECVISDWGDFVYRDWE